MKYRTLPNSSLSLSEVGFGLWTLSTGWWGNYSDQEAIKLMQLAVDLGITLFDAADTYGNGRSETLIAQAFCQQGKRDQITIATKVGYDFCHHGGERRGQREIPQDFSTQAIRFATDEALRRLQTDHIDVLQLHNIRLEQVADDSLWELLEELKKEGKILHHGIALGPAIGWLGEGAETITRRHPEIVQHIHNLLEQHPGSRLQEIAAEQETPTHFFVRVPHSSGMLEGRYTAETVFPPHDHRSHRPKSWLINGVKKIEQLRFLEHDGRTMGQAALQWLLRDPRVVTTLPNIYNEEQIREFAATSEGTPLTEEEYQKIQELVAHNFGLEPTEPHYKGHMEWPLPKSEATSDS
jgi:aryl-alcohol dehydrogenase-like predicted oxidoreductase